MAAAKELVRQDLERLGDDLGRRLTRALTQIGELARATDASSQLRRFLYVMSALVLHQRIGGLSQRQVRELGELGYTILQLCGVKPQTSRLAGLHGELGVVLGQISRQRGDHWYAAWAHASAIQLSGASPPGGASFSALGSADRALRLGAVALALNGYKQVLEDPGAPDPRREKAFLGQLKALRLSGDFLAAKTAASDAQAVVHTPQSVKELAWEMACLAVCMTGDLGAFSQLISKGSSHFAATYAIEAWLWCHASGAQTDRSLSTVRYMMRKKSGLTINRRDRVWHCALAIESAGDTAAPLPFRLYHLGHALLDAPRIQTVDKEMLVWAAAARTLGALGVAMQADLAWDRYRQWNLVLSAGKVHDAFGIRSSGPDETAVSA